jgi:predicted site-specific integrase-resolvase
MTLKTSQEAALSLRLAEGTLANWRVQGRGPAFVRIGGKVCYRDEDIEAFIAGGSRRSTSETEAA